MENCSTHEGGCRNMWPINFAKTGPKKRINKIQESPGKREDKSAPP